MTLVIKEGRGIKTGESRPFLWMKQKNFNICVRKWKNLERRLLQKLQNNDILLQLYTPPLFIPNNSQVGG